MANHTEVSECVRCQKPLGQASKDDGYTVCHDHRRCDACGLVCSAREVAWCLERDMIPRHARCLILTEPNIKRDTLAVIDVVNMCTLLFENPDLPQLLVKDMTFEQRYTFMRSIQALSAQLSVLLIKDKKQFEADTNRRRSEEIKEKAERRLSAGDRALRETKQLGIPAASGAIAKKKLTARDKAIAALVAVGLSQEQAASTVDARLKSI